MNLHFCISGADEGLLCGWGCGVGVGDEEDVVGIGAEGDGVLFEGEEDAAAEFAEDCVFLIDGDTDADGIGDDAAIDGVDAGDDGVGEGYLLECGIVSDGQGGRAEDGEDAVGIG